MQWHGPFYRSLHLCWFFCSSQAWMEFNGCKGLSLPWVEMEPTEAWTGRSEVLVSLSFCLLKLQGDSKWCEAGSFVVQRNRGFIFCLHSSRTRSLLKAIEDACLRCRAFRDHGPQTWVILSEKPSSSALQAKTQNT